MTDDTRDPQERAALVALVAKWRDRTSATAFDRAVLSCADQLQAALSALPSGGAQDDVCAICGSEDVRLLTLRRCPKHAALAVAARSEGPTREQRETFARIYERYTADNTAASCDECEDCGPVDACRYHNLLGEVGVLALAALPSGGSDYNRGLDTAISLVTEIGGETAETLIAGLKASKQ